MGYESKIIIVDHYNRDYSERIAEFKLSCMGDMPIDDLFENEFDGKIYEEHFDEKTNKDCYGQKIRYTKDIDRFVKYLKDSETKEHYRRLQPLIDMLNGFNASEWNDLQVLHFGY